MFCGLKIGINREIGDFFYVLMIFWVFWILFEKGVFDVKVLGERLYGYNLFLLSFNIVI